MQIKNIIVQGFRSIQDSSLLECGRLNVLIGRNNAGKSNFLATIEVTLKHLSRGALAAPWDVTRAEDQFTNRATQNNARITIEFEMSTDIREQLRAMLKATAPQLERSIDTLQAYTSICFTVALTWLPHERQSFLFVESIFTGTARTSTESPQQRITLLHVPAPAASELYEITVAQDSLNEDITGFHELLNSSQLEYIASQPEARRMNFYDSIVAQRPRSPAARTELDTIFRTAKDETQLRSLLKGLISSFNAKIEEVAERETKTSFSAFAGEVRTPPKYALWLMEAYGSTRLLHLRETKIPIGRDEASALLQLKVRRGGTERIRLVQETVKALLGVSIDAFESEAPRRGQRTAEMDVDEFLAEANGAGIREALRLILDLELKDPSLALIEEPEVHLHPGLERAMETYLRDKSRDVQIFVTTHSTNFIDSVSFQNVYLVSRSADKRTVAESVDSGQGALAIPSELGLRLSTVFMYDRLVFVEGPSDEEVLREFARQRLVDLARANVGFVQMGGVRNFAHFAAESTIQLLSRRRVKMWFVVDRDERSDTEVADMAKRLGPLANMKVLERRELENYLLHIPTISRFLNEKTSAGITTTEQISIAIDNALQELQGEVVRLRAADRLLRPIYPQSRQHSGDIPERLRAGIAEIERRLQSTMAETDAIAKEVGHEYEKKASFIVPGSLILDNVARHFGARFRKENGDSLRLARMLPPMELSNEIAILLNEIAAPD